MSRLVPYRSKTPAAVKTRIDETLVTTMYLVQTTGPTSYVVQEQNCDKKHKVLIGALQTCSCGDGDVCIHILFVMLKVLRVPATTPIVWQKSLIDSEIDALLRGDYREKTRAPPAAKPGGGFLKKRGKDNSQSTEPETETEAEAEAQRHELVEGEVCAICQEDMVAEQPLTFCRKGCGNNFHIECMKVFGESRKQSKEHIICPLCRHDWGDLALTELKKAMDVANKAPNVHKGVGCKKCQAKPIRNERYRCVQCKNVDLCDRCFKMNAHINHSFVMKKLVTDTWVPALRSTQKRTDNITSELVEELQNRDLTTNDYDLLLQLDQREKFPLQDFLLTTLGGQRVTAANAKSFGEPGVTCSLCRQSLRIHSDVRVVICGHAFHESCLSRSILSQEYACPHSGCEQILFPGLHHLMVKSKKGTPDADNAQENAKTLPSTQLANSFCIMPMQNQAQARSMSSEPANRRDKQARPIAKRPSKAPQSKPSMQDLTALSIGFAPSSQPLGQRISTLPDIGEAPGSSASSRTRRSENQSRESTIGTRTSTNVPHQMGQDSLTADDRMKHAEQLRSELKNIDKERLRKQRAQREERVRQNQSNNESSHAGLNMMLPPIGQVARESLPVMQRPTPLLTKSRRVEPPKSNLSTDRGASTDQSGLLPRLSIGGIRRM